MTWKRRIGHVGLLAVLVVGTEVAAQVAREPDRVVRGVLDTPVEYTGWRPPIPVDRREIRIGLFGPAADSTDRAGDLLRGAVLAVEEINADGGIEGTPVRLVQRWSQDPWRGGAKDVTRLVYEDSVLAVIGSINGASTHVAEQVVTKARVPLLSPVSADPTLTYIRIPWIFRLPPSDEAQAEVIVAEGLLAAGVTRVGLVTSTDHDGRVFADVIRARLYGGGIAPLFHLEIPPSAGDDRAVVERILAFRPEALVVRAAPSMLEAVLAALASEGGATKVLVPWIPELDPERLSTPRDPEIWLVRPSAWYAAEGSRAFRNAFRRRHGFAPSVAAAYSYDAVRLIANGLRDGGAGRAELREAIARGSDQRGVAGPYRWDNGGGNVGRPVLERLGGKESGVRCQGAGERVLRPTSDVGGQ